MRSHPARAASATMRRSRFMLPMWLVVNSATNFVISPPSNSVVQRLHVVGFEELATNLVLAQKARLGLAAYGFSEVARNDDDSIGIAEQVVARPDRNHPFGAC